MLGGSQGIVNGTKVTGRR